MFETKRLLLRGFNDDVDLTTLIKCKRSTLSRSRRRLIVRCIGFNDYDFHSLMSCGPAVPGNKVEAKGFIQRRPRHELPIFAICEKPANWPQPLTSEPDFYKACGPPIGVLNFQTSRFDYKNRIAVIGLGFPDAKHRGKGYGREVMEWTFEYSFMELGLHRLELEVYSSNESAVALYRKVYVISAVRLGGAC